MVEVLRHTGIRIEELTELSHHSLIQYRLPATGELIPLLQITPSKTDDERLLVISPELADVLSAIMSRIRGTRPDVPLVVSYDKNERVYNPPMPLLFQWRVPAGEPARRRDLAAQLPRPRAGRDRGQRRQRPPAALHLPRLPQDLHHRRDHARDAAAHRPAGRRAPRHQHHHGLQGGLPRRGHQRPPGVHRPPPRPAPLRGIPRPRPTRNGPSSSAISSAARSPSATAAAPTTPRCIHEHACLRCPLLRPDPAQRPRLTRDPRQPDRPHRRSRSARLARRSRRPQSQPRRRRAQARPDGPDHRPPQQPPSTSACPPSPTSPASRHHPSHPSRQPGNPLARLGTTARTRDSLIIFLVRRR